MIYYKFSSVIEFFVIVFNVINSKLLILFITDLYFNFLKYISYFETDIIYRKHLYIE